MDTKGVDRVPFLYADPLKCTGCRICELFCAFYREGVLNPKRARIRVVRMEPAIDKVIACRQCAKPVCAETCPRKAITRNTKTGLVTIDESKCTGCGACVGNCPFGAIIVHPDRKVAIKCDLCGFCVQRCPPKVLKVITTEQLASIRRRELIARVKPVLLERVPRV
jgi:Fe-S-cluster-containing hydrogenase component 2